MGTEEEYDSRFKVMGEASRFILAARVDDVQVSVAEAALANLGGQTIDSVSGGSAPASSDI